MAESTCTTAPVRTGRAQLLRRMPWPGSAAAAEHEPLLRREWLVSNGLGGYASGTVSGVMTRKYHGLLVAALPAPFGRIVMLNHLAEHIRLPDGRKVALGCEERVGSSPQLHGALYLRECRLEAGLPVWQFDLGGWIVEKRLLLPYHQNTVHIMYSLVSGDGTLRLDLRPLLHFRHHEAPPSTADGGAGQDHDAGQPAASARPRGGGGAGPQGGRAGGDLCQQSPGRARRGAGGG